MLSLTIYLCALFVMKVYGQTVNVVPLSVTMYLGDMATAVHTPSDYLYYHITVCAAAIQNATQVSLTVSLPNNPNWNTDTEGYVMLQVSNCPNSFTQQCVIAQNYAYTAHPSANSTIIWNYNNVTDFYIRVLAGNNIQAQFSMEMQFLTNAKPFFYPWTTNSPFSGTIANKTPSRLYQYWKARAIYTVRTKSLKYFSLAYCDENIGITGIDVAIATPPSDTEALITAWACPQTSKANDCTVTNNNNWNNDVVASFSLLTCMDGNGLSTKNGIYIVVEGYGAELANEFTLQATTIY